MLTKFETKSNRVKGLAFHPKRPWVLSSLHSGVIQLWDYRVGTTIDRFEEHEGPVRGVDFHKSQPLFVSGGDDYKVKIWNYKLRRCLFTLHGHLDYIRTVQFHDENPWIVSASDDQTIRIWNWQSRSCVSVLTGHNHYVMCARFHMKEDLVVSASLDQTVRLWDISGLRKKSYTPGSGSAAPDDDILKLPQNLGSDLFGGGDTVVKHVLEGHDRGVNWVSFHPHLPLIISGADDRQLKLWRYNESKAWEVDTLRSHTNNVSCVIFHAKQDLIISDSEDKSIRVWDMSKRSNTQTFRREHDRFWVLAAHPEQNLLAAGHDSGMIVFKLERERLPCAAYRDTLFYVKDRYVRSYDFRTQKDNPLISVRRSGSADAQSSYRSLSYNPAEHSVILTSDSDGGSFELYQLPKDTSRGETSPDPRTGLGAAAVFIARNRFAVLDKAYNQIQIRNLQNEITKKVGSPTNVTTSIFYAGTGSLLVQSEDKMVLFDVQQRTAVAEATVPSIKYVVWNDAMTRVALLSKHSVTLADKKLQNSCTVHEAMRVKSAAFDANDILIYTTLNHLKYCLPNGDNGIIKTLDDCVYVTRVSGSAVFCLDREGKTRKFEIDDSEYLFKLALTQGQYDRVMQMIRENELCGQAIIAYLQEKGFPEVALHFVKDQRLRFNLAVECGNIEVALQSAQELDDKDTWYRLGVEALKQGNHQIVEFSYQKTKNFERLSFLYLITGDMERLSKMLKIYEIYDDTMGRFQAALYLGNVRERIKVLEESGQIPLAYMTAKKHGLTEEADRLRENLEEEPEMEAEDEGLLFPPPPIFREANWPLLTVSKGFFDGAMPKPDSRQQIRAEEMENAMEEIEAEGAWGEEEDMQEGEVGGEDIDNEDGGWDMEDLELPSVPSAAAEASSSSVVFVAPTPGQSVPAKWSQKAKLAAELCCAGDFAAAMRLLNRQLGITNFAPLKPFMMQLYRGAQLAIPGISSMSSTVAYIESKWDGDAERSPPSAPATLYTLERLEEEVKRGYKLVTSGKFNDAVTCFMDILLQIPLLVVETRKEVDDVKELITIAREYLIALRCEIKRKECKEDLKRSAELAVYFTHCKLESVHLVLGLRSAMNALFKLKNYASCANVCRRLLELNPGPKFAQQARQALAQCEKSPEDAVQLNYDARNPFDICSLTFAPIFRGTKFVECPYTGARFFPDCEGEICPLGNLTKIGADASGLVCSQTQIRS